MKESNYVNEFNMPVNTIKRQRSGVTSIGEIDECECIFIKVSLRWETLLIVSPLMGKHI